MLDFKQPGLWLTGVLVLGGLWIAGRTRFSAEARERRRRDRSHRKVVSRKQGPAVKLAVQTPRRKEKH